MKEITKVIYVADDGKEFATQSECFNYECECKKVNNFKRTLNAIADFCFKHSGCTGCPFHDKSADICDITFSEEKIPCNWEF